MNKRKRVIVHDPEQIEFIGEKYLDEYYIQLFEFDKLKVNESHEYSSIDFGNFGNDNKVSWLNVNGLHDAKLIKDICSKLNIHKLVMQDILDTNQRPKLQEFENYIQFSVKSILPVSSNFLETELISFVLSKNYLLSFQEKKGGHFDHIRNRIKGNKGIVRERGSDYLLYLLLGTILDNYFETVDAIEEKINKITSVDINANLNPNTIIEIETMKQGLQLVKKNMEPIKIAIGSIEKGINLIEDRHLKYYYDLKDQCSQLLDEIHTLSIRLDSSTNMIFSLQGFKMNQIMKTLTIISTIFIPLTFIVGVYGMNFRVMPELILPWGYYLIWSIMLIIIIIMLVYFKRKKWF